MLSHRGLNLFFDGDSILKLSKRKDASMFSLLLMFAINTGSNAESNFERSSEGSSKVEPTKLVWRVEVVMTNQRKEISSEHFDLSRETFEFHPKFENLISCSVSAAERDWELPGDLRSLTCQFNESGKIKKVTTAIACSLDSAMGNAVALDFETEDGRSLFLGLLCGRIKHESFERPGFHFFG